MSYGPISRGPVQVLESATSSTRTSVAVLVADWRQITASLKTAGTGTHTLQATDADGFQSAIAEGDWSNISTVGAAGLFTIDPGMRWLRWVKPAADSLATVILAGRT